LSTERATPNISESYQTAISAALPKSR